MKKFILFLFFTALAISCNKPKTRSSRNVKLVTNKQLQKFENIYGIDAKYGGHVEGLYIYQKGDNFFGTYYETSPSPKKYKIKFLKVIGDTLRFKFAKNNETHYWDLVVNDNGAALKSTNYDDEYILNKALDAARPLMNNYKRFYKELMGEKYEDKKQVVQKEVMDFSKVRGTLIVSRDPNGVEKHLGIADEVQQKNLFTWYIYYFAVKQNGQIGHVKVTYDNSSEVGVLGHVDDVTFHKPGSIIPMGKFNSIRSPK